VRSIQITIKDLAKELGISPSTVSRALKDHPDISKETKRQVNELAERLNYQPNNIALSLRQRKTNTIGVVIPEIIHFFFSTVISGIEDIAYKAGYSVIIAQSNESYDRELKDTKALFNGKVDGMLISISRETSDFGHFESLMERGLPLVFFDRVCDAIITDKIIIDDKEAADQATQHLIDQGCRRILHLSGPKSLLIGQQRLGGYLQALERNKIPVSDELIIDCGHGTEIEAAQKVHEFLQKYPAFDGVFATNDVAAMGAMMALKEKNVKIPEEVAVIGFGNWRFGALTDPPLSTVEQPGYEMGCEAAKHLIRQIELKDDESFEATTKILKTRVIPRKSSLRNS
jgi:LacI family transcriptional regulator